ncbi:hypothetical protein BN1221_01052c [Brenneria goodwinii]|uniref:Uncharacterized protein n=1 Tax=Brenneria goodwinii TaxID=1109412 RepID=A0A0G4JRU3_9GAMM|nr:hypothetical protein BN1221_01052c [Brenneria goodwinii]
MLMVRDIESPIVYQKRECAIIQKSTVSGKAESKTRRRKTLARLRMVKEGR